MSLNESTEGRWLTPDLLGGDITNPQSLNRYAYALNNSATLTDPMGLDATDCTPNDSGGVTCSGPDSVTVNGGTAPFETSDSTLQLAEQLGVGTRDLSRIEVRGVPINKVKFKFRAA